MAANFPLSIILQAIDRVSGPLRGVAARIQALGARVAALRGRLSAFSETAGINKLAGSLGGVGKAAIGVGSGLVSAAGRLAGLTAAAGLGTAGMMAFGQAFADTTGAIGDAAERTGITRERFQELGFAATLGGSSVEAIEGALTKMNLAVGNAAKGSKELTQMFSGLGIKLKTSNGTLKSTDELFDTFVDRISKIKDPSLQAQAAVKVFGKSATELLPLIRGGKDGLKEMADQARRLGVVIKDDAVREGEELGDTLDTISMAMKGVGNAIGAAIVPQMNRLGALFIETIIKYRPKIEEFANAFAEKLPGNIEKVVGFMGQLYDKLTPVIDGIVWLTDKFGGANVVMTALAVFVGGPLLLSLIALGQAIVGVGVALLTTPIGWFLISMAAIATAAYAIYDSWDQIGEFFAAKWEAVKAAFSEGIINGMVQVWKEYNPVTLMIEAFGGFMRYLGNLPIVQILKDKMLSAVSAIQSALPDWAKELFGIGDTNVTATGAAPTAASATPIGMRAAAIGQRAARQVAGREDRSKITVDFKNAPQGTRVTTDNSNSAKFDTNLGFAMGAPK